MVGAQAGPERIDLVEHVADVSTLGDGTAAQEAMGPPGQRADSHGIGIVIEQIREIGHQLVSGIPRHEHPGTSRVASRQVKGAATCLPTRPIATPPGL